LKKRSCRGFEREKQGVKKKAIAPLKVLIPSESHSVRAAEEEVPRTGTKAFA
jgi:hypothetical protein